MKLSRNSMTVLSKTVKLLHNFVVLSLFFFSRECLPTNQPTKQNLLLAPARRWWNQHLVCRHLRQWPVGLRLGLCEKVGMTRAHSCIHIGRPPLHAHVAILASLNAPSIYIQRPEKWRLGDTWRSGGGRLPPLPPHPPTPPPTSSAPWFWGPLRGDGRPRYILMDGMGAVGRAHVCEHMRAHSAQWQASGRASCMSG